MSTVPAGTELTRPFLPAKDFELSKRFYEALGFEKLLDADVAIFRMGRGEFLLQSYYQKEWAENRSEEHTSELQSLMRLSYAAFCLKKKKDVNIPTFIYNQNISNITIRYKL